MTETVPIWAFMGLIGVLNLLLGMMLMRLWKAVDDNTAAVTELRIGLPETYATKDETNRHHDEDASRFAATDASIVSMRERLHGVDLRVTEIAGGVATARAELR